MILPLNILDDILSYFTPDKIHDSIEKILWVGLGFIALQRDYCNFKSNEQNWYKSNIQTPSLWSNGDGLHKVII